MSAPLPLPSSEPYALGDVVTTWETPPESPWARLWRRIRRRPPPAPAPVEWVCVAATAPDGEGLSWWTPDS